MPARCLSSPGGGDVTPKLAQVGRSAYQEPVDGCHAERWDGGVSLPKVGAAMLGAASVAQFNAKVRSELQPRQP